MAFFDNYPYTPPYVGDRPPTGGIDPTDPRVIRRLAALGLGPGMPMQPPSVAPPSMPIDTTPPPAAAQTSQALQRIYAAQPPSVTSQGLISAMKGPNDWSDAPAPAMDPRMMMRRYGITDLTPPPAPQVNPAHGFWGKLGQHLLGAAEGAGSQRGLLPMLIGGIAGGVRPQLGANAWYNNVTTPRWQQQAAAQQGLANTRLGQIAQVGALTGIDPTTGQPTYGAQQASDKAEAQEQYRQMQDQWKQQHDKLERDVAEGKISQAQAALDSKQIIATMQSQMKEMELNFRDRMATTAEQKAQIAQERLALEQQKAQLGQGTTEQTTFNETPNTAYQQIQQKWYRQQQLNPDGSKPEWMSQSDYDLSFKEANRQAEKEAKAGGVKATTRNETKQITKGGGQPASTANPAKVFPKSMLPKYMAAHPEYKTAEEAMKHIQDTGYTVQ